MSSRIREHPIGSHKERDRMFRVIVHLHVFRESVIYTATVFTIQYSKLGIVAL